jgi:hypothetical protein
MAVRVSVPWNRWSSWLLSYEKGLKVCPDIPYIVLRYEKLVQVNNTFFPSM